MSLEEQNNITYKIRRYRSVETHREGRTGEMGDNQGKNPADEKEDILIKGILNALQDLVEG